MTIRKKTKKANSSKKKTNPIVTWVLIPIIVGAVSVLLSRVYTFVDGVFPLWYVALGLGVIISTLTSIYLYALFKKNGEPTKKRLWTSILIFALMLFISFVTIGSLFGHINHLFDFSEPERYTVVIEDKDYRGGRGKAPGLYEFVVTVKGETINIEVPRIHYYTLDEGELYIVEYHKGLFNEPYYIWVGSP